MNLKTHLKLAKLVRKTRTFGRNRIYFDQIKSILDDEYCDSVSEKDFKRLGYIYYHDIK